MSDTTEAMRAAFEAWAKACGRIFLDRQPSGNYRHVFTQEAWVGWQAALAHPTPATPAVTDSSHTGAAPRYTVNMTDAEWAEYLRTKDSHRHRAEIVQLAWRVFNNELHPMAMATQVEALFAQPSPERKDCEPVAVPAEIEALTDDTAQAHQQCRAVVHLALALAEVHVARAAILAAGMGPVDVVGESSARVMEWLGDLLNGMDAAEEGDEWMDDIFEAAHERWSVAPPPPAERHYCERCGKRLDSTLGVLACTPPGDASKLWAVNIQGPDDLIAQPSRLAALELAAAMNTTFGRVGHHEFDPIMRALVVEWPYTPDSHAAALAAATKEPQQ